MTEKALVRVAAVQIAPELARIIAHCLEKEPDKRPGSMREPRSLRRASAPIVRISSPSNRMRPEGTRASGGSSHPLIDATQSMSSR